MKKAVIGWGRMNPPTIGHQKLVDRIITVAKREHGDPRVYLTHTQSPKKDPLQYRDKIRLAAKAFGPVVKPSTSRTIIELMKELQRDGYKEVTIVAGSDRVREYKTLLNKYNGKDYSFDQIKVVSAGERDPDAEGASGMSATKMRLAAAEGELETFHSGAPTKLSKAEKTKLYNLVRKGMLVEEIEMFLEKLKKTGDIQDTDVSDKELKKAVDSMKEEDYDDEDSEEDIELTERAPLTIQQRMKRSRQMKRLAPKMKRLRQIKKFRMADTDRLTTRSRRIAKNILRKKFAGAKGGQYSSLSPSQKITIDRLVANKGPVIAKLAKRLMPMVRKKEIERIRQARKPRKESVEKFVESTDITKGFKDLFNEGDAAKAAKERIRREKERDKQKHDRMLDRARSTDTRAANRKEDFKPDSKSSKALELKAVKADCTFEEILDVYYEGVESWINNPKDNVTAQQYGYARVNSFIVNEDLAQAKRNVGVDDKPGNPCWKDKKLGTPKTKMKGGKEVPNCIPEDAPVIAGKKMTRLGSKPGSYKSLVKRHLGAAAAEKIDKSDGNKLVAKGIKTGNKELVRKGSFIKNVIAKEEVEALDESLQIEKGAGYGTLMTAADLGIEFSGAFKHHPSVVEEEGGAGEEGTKKIKDKYKKETPGQ